jgi:hypothetical protein
MKNLNQEVIGYLAGFIDGEGSLMINKREHIGYKGKRYESYSAYVDIGNTNREVLEWIKDVVGVTSNVYENPQKGNRKTAYRLRVCYKQAYSMIQTIMPWLIIKKKQSEVFLKYLSATIEEKEILHKEMAMLNQRGIYKV